MKHSVWILSIFLLGCPHNGPSPVSPEPGPEGGTATCDEACSNATKLFQQYGDVSGCHVAVPTPKGHTCVEVCQNALNNGVAFATWCIAHATSCDDIHNCQ